MKILLVVILTMMGCHSLHWHPTTDSNGKQIIVIECGKRPGECIIWAGEACPHGYDQIDWIEDNRKRFTMVVRCK